MTDRSDLPSAASSLGGVRFLTTIPVYNEVRHVDAVLSEVARNAGDVLVVDDGSSDGTAARLAARSGLFVVTHERNRGYGAALKTAFDFAIQRGYEYLVTVDCDGQHEPQRIGHLVAACADVDIASGSRYLDATLSHDLPPADRRRINFQITEELNCRFGLRLTDAFCGFKAYRVASLARLAITEPGYAMPLELWVQAACLGFRIVEVATPLIYLDEKRSFGGTLDNPDKRLRYYHRVIDQAILKWNTRRHPSPASSLVAERCRP